MVSAIPGLAGQSVAVVTAADGPTKGIGHESLVAVEVVFVDGRAQRGRLGQDVAVGVMRVTGRVVVAISLAGDVAVEVIRPADRTGDVTGGVSDDLRGEPVAIEGAARRVVVPVRGQRHVGRRGHTDNAGR